MQDSETGQRGYLLTGDKKYLEPFFKGKESIGISLNLLTELTLDNEYQQQRLRVLQPLIWGGKREVSGASGNNRCTRKNRFQ